MQEETVVFGAKPFVSPATCIVGDGLVGSNFTVSAVSGALSGVFYKLSEASALCDYVLTVTFQKLSKCVLLENMLPFISQHTSNQSIPHYKVG